jgi:hypothetical protein
MSELVAKSTTRCRLFSHPTTTFDGWAENRTPMIWERVASETLGRRIEPIPPEGVARYSSKLGMGFLSKSLG